MSAKRSFTEPRYTLPARLLIPLCRPAPLFETFFKKIIFEVDFKRGVPFLCEVLLGRAKYDYSDVGLLLLNLPPGGGLRILACPLQSLLSRTVKKVGPLLPSVRSESALSALRRAFPRLRQEEWRVEVFGAQRGRLRDSIEGRRCGAEPHWLRLRGLLAL